MVNAGDLWEIFWAKRSTSARNRLVEHYLPLVERQAERLARKLPCCSADELVSDGAMGLMLAIDAFDPWRGVRFETYAATRIVGSILDQVRLRDWVPRLVRQRERQGLAKSVAIGSLQEMADEDGRSWEPAARQPEPSARAEQRDFRKLVERALAGRERRVVMAYYFRWLTMAQIATAMSVSESMVWQVHARALRRLRRKLAKHAEAC